ncbi:hypothetical protein [Vibrio barjaei]|uniref:hypothetical protein n=1 Tax=Vibrio barjaei TaxID=1676683 RepID=UPI002283B264|nr:hypothetical protein [Vibrio barjaei]MCY9870411.1 hypothetical protein [Vibrio barjaei]
MDSDTPTRARIAAHFVQNIKDNAPENAAYWSPAVGQYFDRQFCSLASALRGKFIQVDKEYRSELIPLNK